MIMNSRDALVIFVFGNILLITSVIFGVLFGANPYILALFFGSMICIIYSLVEFKIPKLETKQTDN